MEKLFKIIAILVLVGVSAGCTVAQIKGDSYRFPESENIDNAATIDFDSDHFKLTVKFMPVAASVEFDVYSEAAECPPKAGGLGSIVLHQYKQQNQAIVPSGKVLYLLVEAVSGNAGLGGQMTVTNAARFIPEPGKKYKVEYLEWKNSSVIIQEIVSQGDEQVLVPVHSYVQGPIDRLCSSGEKNRNQSLIN